MDDPFQSDARNWSRGPVKLYFAREDPRFLAPKYPPGLGWTVNYAHAAAPLVIYGPLLLVAVVLTLTR